MTGAVESDCYSLRGQRVTPLDPQYIKNIAYALCHVLNLKPSITKRIVCESGGHANGLTYFIFRFLRRPLITIKPKEVRHGE